MKAAFDLDNVLAGTIASAQRALASDLGIDITEVQLTNIYGQPFTHSDPEIAARLKVDHAFWDRDDVMDGCEPLPGAVEAIAMLDRAGALAGYVTRRPGHIHRITMPWLKRNGFALQPVHHVGTTDPNTTYSSCKSIACRKLGATYLVDDHASEISSAHAAGVSVIVVDADIGRADRMNMLARHPQVPLARDAAHAVEMLLNQIGKMAA